MGTRDGDENSEEEKGRGEGKRSGRKSDPTVISKSRRLSRPPSLLERARRRSVSRRN